MKNLKDYLRLLTLGLSILLVSCDTEIPDIDSDPPNFLFRITGDGFSQDFDQDTDFESFQLNLRADTDYEFYYSVGDSGGMNRAHWQWVSDSFEFETIVAPNWNLSSSGISSYYTWQGDRSDPVTGAILNGTFRTESVAQSTSIGHSFSFMVRDFGGASAMENVIYEDLNILTGNHPTEIKYF